MKTQITTRTVGQHFGTSGLVIVAGKTVYEGPVRPYRFVAAAARDAETWVADRGGLARVAAAVVQATHDAETWAEL